MATRKKAASKKKASPAQLAARARFAAAARAGTLRKGSKLKRNPAKSTRSAPKVSAKSTRSAPRVATRSNPVRRKPTFIIAGASSTKAIARCDTLAGAKSVAEAIADKTGRSLRVLKV